MGVATTTIPSIISSNVIVSAFAEIVILVGVILGAGVGMDVDVSSVAGLEEVLGNDSGENADSEFWLDVGDKPPTVMFLTISLLTVKLYS